MPRPLLKLLIAALAGGALAGAAIGTTTGAFSGQAANSGNTFQAAASFGSCSSPGTQTLTPSKDAYLDQGSSSSNFGTSPYLATKSYYKTSGANAGPKNIRSLVHYNLPTVPSGCVVSSAFLRVNAWSAASGRTIQAYRAAASWTETGVTWSNQPATTGTAVTASSATGWMQWEVTSHVSAMYSGSNDGFLVRDSVEDSTSDKTLAQDSREGSKPPELIVRFAAAACATPTSTTVNADKDVILSEGFPTSNFGTLTYSRIRSQSANDARTAVNFALPTLGSNCEVMDAKLRGYAYTVAAGRTLEAHRLAASWTETGITWGNQPATTGTPVSVPSPSAAGWLEWSVTSHVQAMYQGSADGWVLRDSVEDAGTAVVQELYAREAGLPPQLQLLIG